MVRTIFLSFLLVLFLLSPAAAQNTITVGDAAAAPGQKDTGYIHVPAGPESPAEKIPVSIINGSRPGPVLALIAGTHGYEYPPIIALQRIGKELTPDQISGAVIIVHILNMPSFMKRMIYYNPYDWQNQNRVFPGKKNGTSSQRIAWHVTEQVIKQCDYLVDNHCGDGNEDLMPYLYCTSTGDPATDKKTREMADIYGMKLIILDSGRPDDPGASVYVGNTALLMGKPALTIESGKLGRTDEEDVAAVVNGTYNLMKHLKMIPGEPEITADPVYVDHYEVLRSEHDGIFYPLVHRGHHVEEGEMIGYVTDFFGETVQRVYAPYTGIVLYIVATPPMGVGEPMASVGRFVK